MSPLSSRPAVQLIAIDLDGTLLNDRKDVSPRTAEARRRRAADGVKVVLATARPPRAVRHIYANLGLDTPQINYNGAMIWHEPSRKAIFHRPMSGKLVRTMIEYARELVPHVIVGCEILDHWYTDRFEQTPIHETAKLFKPDYIGPIAAFCHQDITKLLLFADPPAIAQLDGAIRTIFHGRIAAGAESNLMQIMDHRVSKAVALQKLARYFEIDMDHVMAIGDAPNDLGMVQIAGIGVAVANADPRVKEVARWIAPSNNDSGVFQALVKYAL
jgi:5-amino-6-(5-phospho-D-ribitylamino)uracil phosphatase